MVRRNRGRPRGFPHQMQQLLRQLRMDRREPLEGFPAHLLTSMLLVQHRQGSERPPLRIPHRNADIALGADLLQPEVLGVFCRQAR